MSPIKGKHLENQCCYITFHEVLYTAQQMFNSRLTTYYSRNGASLFYVKNVDSDLEKKWRHIAIECFSSQISLQDTLFKRFHFTGRNL